MLSLYNMQNWKHDFCIDTNDHDNDDDDGGCVWTCMKISCVRSYSIQLRETASYS